MSSVADERQYTALALTAGQQYVFRVAAENKVGVGDFAEMTQSVTAKSVHGKSTNCVLAFHKDSNTKLTGGTGLIQKIKQQRKPLLSLSNVTVYTAAEKKTTSRFQPIAIGKVQQIKPTQPSFDSAVNALSPFGYVLMMLIMQ